MTCQHCGTVVRRLNKRAKYCSTRCRSAYHELGRMRRPQRTDRRVARTEAA